MNYLSPLTSYENEVFTQEIVIQCNYSCHATERHIEIYVINLDE